MTRHFTEKKRKRLQTHKRKFKIVLSTHKPTAAWTTPLSRCYCWCYKDVWMCIGWTSQSQDRKVSLVTKICGTDVNSWKTLGYDFGFTAPSSGCSWGRCISECSCNTVEYRTLKVSSVLSRGTGSHVSTWPFKVEKATWSKVISRSGCFLVVN